MLRSQKKKELYTAWCRELTLHCILTILQRSSVKCSYLTHTNNKQEGQEEAFGGNGFVYGIDCGDSFAGVFLSPNSLGCVHQICTAFCMSLIPQ